MHAQETKQIKTFEMYRPLLFSIAYRMLGSVMEAEAVVGRDRVARLLLVSYRKRPNNLDIELAEVNGVLSILFRVENQVVGVMSFDGNDAGITDIWAVWNPDKLQHLH